LHVLVEPAGPQDATRILRLTIAHTASRSSNDNPKPGVEVPGKRVFGNYNLSQLETIMQLCGWYSRMRSQERLLEKGN
jgi:hypothetical protein